ncbi:MAG: hypothetical protein CEE43_14005 [Promethearchaeota archaeon Loki_b32]|nr:MAG: hypothetical protein CEE43_14005 [Candidatus Lokiarchaeota archaeon Loki_b32]
MNNEKSYQTFLAQKLNSNECKVILEAPYKHKRVDIVKIEEKKIICIEVKINNFSNLLFQAAQNLVFSDFSYIAIPEKKYSNKIYKKAKELSLGIILITDKNYNTILTPKQNPYKILSFYNYFKNSLMRCH